MNAVVYSPVRNEKGPAKGLFPHHGDLHNICIIVNYWKFVLWLRWLRREYALASL